MSLKNRIEGELKLPVRLRAGAPGSLKVLVNGTPIFSKKDGALDPEDIVGRIRQMAPAH